MIDDVDDERHPTNGHRVADAPTSGMAFEDPLRRRQVRAETTRMAAVDAALPTSEEWVRPDEVVGPVPDQVYRPPPWLARTASPAVAAEYGDLLAALRDVNLEWVGERVYEFQAYMAGTGECADLRDAFLRWAGAYFRPRVDLSRLCSQYPTPTHLYNAVAPQVRDLLERAANVDHSVHVPLLEAANLRGRWLLHWLGMPADGNPLAGGPGTHLLPITPLRECEADGDTFGWGSNWMPELIRRVDARRRAEVDRAAAIGAEGLRVHLAGVAADVQHIRPFLVKNFKPEKTIVRLADDLLVAWLWATRFGIGAVVAAQSEAWLRDRLAVKNFGLGATVRHDGLFVESATPWLTAADLSAVRFNPVAVNLVVLEALLDRLLEFYARIDDVRVRASLGGPPADNAGTGKLANSLVGTADAVFTDPEAASAVFADAIVIEDNPAPGRQLRGLRLDRFLRALADRFGCTVRSGKGSEVVVTRPGGRAFVFGRHKRDPEVYPGQVARCLRRLAVPAAEFDREFR